MLAMSKSLKKIKCKYHDDNLELIAEDILESLENGDAILLKGSNSLNLKVIINNIVNLCERL